MTSLGRATHRPATKMFRRTTAMLKKPKVIANTPTPPARVTEIADRVAIMSATNNYKYTGRHEMKEFRMQWLISQMRNCDFLPCLFWMDCSRFHCSPLFSTAFHRKQK
jgi:hypothetical protein